MAVFEEGVIVGLLEGEVNENDDRTGWMKDWHSGGFRSTRNCENGTFKKSHRCSRDRLLKVGNPKTRASDWVLLGTFHGTT